MQLLERGDRDLEHEQEAAIAERARDFAVRRQRPAPASRTHSMSAAADVSRQRARGAGFHLANQLSEHVETQNAVRDAVLQEFRQRLADVAMLRKAA